jgi:broad specificity phosphatase PhoE
MDHKREVWLLRHGATEWSKNGRHTGRTDIPLLPEGEEQAKALSVTLSHKSFAKVLVSPALRARRTCELAGLISSAEVTEDLWE